MTRPVYKLLEYFRAHAYQAILLEDLVRESGKSRGTVLRYLAGVRRACPRGWRLRREYVTDDLGTRWTYYRFCRTAESFRRQQTIWRESA